MKPIDKTAMDLAELISHSYRRAFPESKTTTRGQVRALPSSSDPPVLVRPSSTALASILIHSYFIVKSLFEIESLFDPLAFLLTHRGAGGAGVLPEPLRV